MAKRPANQASKTGSVPAKKAPVKKTPAAKKAAPTYGDWGDAKQHSIPLAQHQSNVIGKAAGLAPGMVPTDMSSPLTYGQGQGLAQLQADQVYAPQIRANQTLQNSTPGWFKNYQDTVAGLRAGAQANAAPVLASAQQGVQNATATAPGLDPASAQYATDQQAGQGRQAIAQAGANQLGGILTAGDVYMAGQQALAARDLPQVLAYQAGQGADLQSQRGQAVVKNLGDIRTGEQNYGIAQATLGANVANQQSDNALATKTAAQLAKDKKASRVVSRKNSSDRLTATTNAQAVRDQKAADTAAAKKTAEQTKKTAAIQKSTGAAKTNVSDLIKKWNSYVGQETDDTTKPKDPKTGQYPARKVTPADIKRILGADKKNTPGMIHVALLVRTGKPLDKDAIDYLHSSDPNVRIPKEWLRGRKKTSGAGSAADPKAYGGNK